jgi:hypothetical protein
MTAKHWLCCAFLCASFSILYAQDKTTRFRSIGFLTGTGWELQIKERYQPIFFTGDFCWQLGHGNKNRFFAFYLEPQCNLVDANKPINLEFGTNIGIRYIQRLSKRFWIYQMLGSGPHFMSATIRRQIDGFLFSDNLGIGFLKQVSGRRPIALNVQFFFRHLSNAGFKEPNGGINTLNLRVGVSWLRLPISWH